MSRPALLLGALAWCAAAAADAGSPGAQLLQKELFVRRLLEARGSAAPADAGAARLHARALEHLRRGEYAQAQARLDESIRAMQRPAAAAQEPAYERLRASVRLMQETYARYAGARRDLHGTLLFDAREALEQAEALRGAQREGEAVRALELAEQSLARGISAALDNVTVTYAARFSSVEEEFRHEAQRQQGYAALLPAAIRQLRPGAAALMLVERYVESSQASAARADAQAARGEWQAALESMRSAAQFLQRGLGAAGLALPQGSPE